MENLRVCEARGRVLSILIMRIEKIIQQVYTIKLLKTQPITQLPIANSSRQDL